MFIQLNATKQRRNDFKMTNAIATNAKTTTTKTRASRAKNVVVDATNDVVNDVVNVDATTTHNVETNASNDVTTTTTTTTRATTRALNNTTLNIDTNANVQTIKIDDAQIKIVKTSTNAMRIDHSICSHESTKNARSKCRARIANAK